MSTFFNNLKIFSNLAKNFFYSELIGCRRLDFKTYTKMFINFCENEISVCNRIILVEMNQSFEAYGILLFTSNPQSHPVKIDLMIIPSDIFKFFRKTFGSNS